MAISKDLFLAILSMDSYNRGYGVGIELSGTKIGAATIGDDSLILNTDPNDPDRVDQAAGFYAIAYDVKASGVAGIDSDTTVISYRGTEQYDDDFGGNGITNSWWFRTASTVGTTAAITARTQVPPNHTAAQDFHQAVTGLDNQTTVMPLVPRGITHSGTAHHQSPQIA